MDEMGNINRENFELACCVCGSMSKLNQYAHRNSEKKIVGYVFCCSSGCIDNIQGVKFVLEGFVRKDNGEHEMMIGENDG